MSEETKETKRAQKTATVQVLVEVVQGLIKGLKPTDTVEVNGLQVASTSNGVSDRYVKFASDMRNQMSGKYRGEGASTVKKFQGLVNKGNPQALAELVAARKTLDAHEASLGK